MKIKILTVLSLVAFSAHAQRSQCGPSDERQLSSHPAVGRMIQSMSSLSGCTGTMISNHCMISAGHCASYAQLVEFNTPLSKLGKLQHPEEKDIYPLDRIIDYAQRGIGDDWMVFKLKDHPITGEVPGMKQGYLPVAFTSPQPPFLVEIVGYGADRRLDRNFAQQRSTGFVTSFEESTIRHQLDTQGGNSGSSIVTLPMKEIVGVHTHGGCSTVEGAGANAGTLIVGNPLFMSAIEQCLNEDRD